MCFKIIFFAITIDQIDVCIWSTHKFHQPTQIDRVGNTLSLMKKADPHELFTLFRIERSKTLPCLAAHMSTSSYRPYKGVQPSDQLKIER